MSACGEPCAGAADPAAVVTCGPARFTVLTDRLLRMEYSPDGAFEDNATFTFVNRRLPVPKFNVVQQGGGIVLETEALRLTYAGGDFSAKTLSVESRADAQPAFRWRFGDADKGNLLGTQRTLDGVSSWERGLKGMEKGILSRDGWAVVDDSKNFLLAPTHDHWGRWVAPRPSSAGKGKDLYFFGYGHDYKAALADYVRVAGKIPLPPRWAFGYWWSRYWQYSDTEIRELVETMHSLSIPIDVMIIDMEWHDTWGIAAGAAKDCFKQSVGWTGYTWKKELFPAPKQLLAWCEANGLKTALNLHPASGIQPQESCYAAFADAYGWDRRPEPVPFRISEAKWADCWFDAVLGPMEKEGVDFWWLDWQQWKTSKYVKDLSVTFWLNHTMWEHMREKSPERPLIYHRWGGLGSHRYQTGFSGDTTANWDVLAFEAWFTATAGNVGYGYWGHDLGGHASGGKPTDPELYTRWMQYGVFSPTFKTHCAKELENERRIWRHPEHFLPLRETFRLRYRLTPYVYTMARKAYDTGLSLCRPLYWDWPEEEASYGSRQIVYQFGDDLLASAVTNAIDKATGLATMRYDLPKGRWFDMSAGEWVTGGETVTRTYAIDEFPWFARPGAVIPMYPDSVSNLQRADGSAYVLTFVPGEGGAARLYEDDGTGKDYATAGAWTPVARRGDVVTIGARDGAYAGAPASRSWELRFLCRLPPEKVEVDGRPLAYDRFGGADTWTYDGHALSVVVRLAARPADKPVSVRLFGSAERVAGDVGRFRRFARLDEEYKYAFGEMVHPWAMLPDEYLRVAETASHLTAAPQAATAILAGYDAARFTFLDELAGKRKLSGPFAVRLAAQLGLPVPKGPAAFPRKLEFADLKYGPWTVETDSENATVEIRALDDRHFDIVCSEPVSADVSLRCFSGFVRVQPLDADGTMRNEVVLTRGKGVSNECLIFLSPGYRATRYRVTITN